MQVLYKNMLRKFLNKFGILKIQIYKLWRLSNEKSSFFTIKHNHYCFIIFY